MILDLLDDLIRHEHYAVAFFDQFFNVFLLSKAVVHLIPLPFLEYVVSTGIILHWISLQMQWFLQPGLVLHLG